MEQLHAPEEGRNRVLDELKEMKMEAQGANMKFNREISSVKESLRNTNQELKDKEKTIATLKLELEKAGHLERCLAEKDDVLEKMKVELRTLKDSEAQNRALLSESQVRIKELESEVQRAKELEKTMIDSMVSQANQLEESKLEIVSLHQELEKLQNSTGKNCSDYDSNLRDEIGRLKSEIQLANENLIRAQEQEKLALEKAMKLEDEVGVLRNELKMATEAEENGKKAMDDLALALKEVAIEASQFKEKHSVSEAELKHANDEIERYTSQLKDTEQRYRALLEEARKEADLFKSTSERLRIEAEESLLASNDRETGFVECIKRAEEERLHAQQENQRLLALLKEAEEKSATSKEDHQKLRDIMKQALNESNAAKEAAGIAQAENSQLKDTLAEKENALIFLSTENENLKINEAAALDYIKELKKLLSESSAKEPNRDEKEKSSHGFTFNLQELRTSEVLSDDEEVEVEEALKGSIFDLAETPDSTTHQKKASSPFVESAESASPDDLDHMDESESERNSRKKKALLRRFGDLLKRRGYPLRSTPV